MAFTVRLDSTAGAERLWSVLSDFADHGRFVPATTIRTDAGEPRVGWGFTARTGRGLAAVPDRMLLTVWDPPHRFRLVKLGPVLTGWADAAVVATPTGSRLTWSEEVRPRGLPSRLGGAADAVARRAYCSVLARFVAAAEGS
ncbi:MAG: SRPBCC family protein [Nostocoides sp.]